MMKMRGGRRKGHRGGAIADDEDEQIALGRGTTEGEMGGARARGGKGK